MILGLAVLDALNDYLAVDVCLHALDPGLLLRFHTSTSHHLFAEVDIKVADA